MKFRITLVWYLLFAFFLENIIITTGSLAEGHSYETVIYSNRFHRLIRLSKNNENNKIHIENCTIGNSPEDIQECTKLSSKWVDSDDGKQFEEIMLQKTKDKGLSLRNRRSDFVVQGLRSVLTWQASIFLGSLGTAWSFKEIQKGDARQKAIGKALIGAILAAVAIFGYDTYNTWRMVDKLGENIRSFDHVVQYLLGPDQLEEDLNLISSEAWQAFIQVLNESLDAHWVEYQKKFS